MHAQMSSIRSRAMRPRTAWPLAAAALGLALALGGCRAGARNAGSQTMQQTQTGAGAASTGASPATSNSTSSAALQQLQRIDTQNQSDATQLNAAQSGASVNYSSQENETQP